MVTLPQFWVKISRICTTLALVALMLPVAYAADSTNYKIDSDQALPSQFRQSSGSYTVDGSIEPIVGISTSATYDVESGSPTRIESTTTPGSSTPGGGGGTTGSITVDGQACQVAYKNLLPMSGTRTREVIYMFLNGDMSGFYFPDEISWTRTAWLKDGNNELIFFGRNVNGQSTPYVTLNMQKLRMGDVNQDGMTNDYDLSVLSRRWNDRGDCATDFNRDNITDDYDLSLLASYWS